MKAVLVLDIPSELDANNLLIDYCVHTKGEYKTIRKGGNHHLKPLPRKAELENYSSGLIGMVDTAWMKGYNECLEYIVGETE